MRELLSELRYLGVSQQELLNLVKEAESVMIEVNGLVKRFDGFAALDGAALSVPAGSVYGLVGPNGAGKSTLIRHLTGIFRQDAGTVRIGGEDVWRTPL